MSGLRSLLDCLCDDDTSEGLRINRILGKYDIFKDSDIVRAQLPTDDDFDSVTEEIADRICEPLLLSNAFGLDVRRRDDDDGRDDDVRIDEVFRGLDQQSFISDDVEARRVPSRAESGSDVALASMPLRCEFADRKLSIEPSSDGNSDQIVERLRSVLKLKDEEIPGFMKELTSEHEHLGVDGLSAEVDERPEVRVSEDKAELGEKWVVQESFNPEDFEKIRPFLCHSWQFELDDFQKHAIVQLHKSAYVFVAAHTSAGKTVVAEYAIALALAHKTRCFYCSPIKALSNQKYREFKLSFGDVGLVTGDCRLDPDASCVIMTTEILRTMLYNRKDTISNLEYLIFDEVHYVNDHERGMVWEEVFILIPSRVNIVMLSATVSNAREFAQWVGSTKGRPVHLITTPRRPVPLRHFAYTGMSACRRAEMFLLQDENNQFQMTGYTQAAEAFLRHNPEGLSQAPRPRIRQAWLELLKTFEKDNLLPAIGFIFSRNKIDRSARMLDRVRLNSQVERDTVIRFRDHMLQRIPTEDRELSQVKMITEMTERGIGIHHSGLLPIMKEYVEILFSSSLIKLLLATETFAMGVNMPAHTVIFCDIDKYDGQVWRSLYPGEYTQMSGRAGRRSLDSVGNVVIMCTERMPESETLQTMINGQPTPLLSKFRLNFNVILNIERNQQCTVLDMVKSSFGQYAEQRSTLMNLRELTLLQNQERKLKADKDLPS